MASATDLLEQAKALGVMIRVVEGGVLEASQSGALPPSLRDELQLHRADVIRALADAPTGTGLDDAATLRDAWRRTCFELGETAGWPALPYKPGYSIAQGAVHWRVWMKRASVPDMVMVVDAIPNVLSQFRVGE